MIRRPNSPFALVVSAALAAGAWSPVAAATLTLQPAEDTTLFEVAPASNLGGADFFNAGTTGNPGYHNRALLRFDLTGIPAGSQIIGMSLSMDVVRQPQGDRINSTFSLRRVFQSWGEGEQVPAGSPGFGDLAAPGEATWTHRFAGGLPWAAPGGLAGTDFSTVPSSSTFVFGLGDPVVFEATPEILADLQHWVDQPGANFGWMMMTESEEALRTARSFASSESGFGPTLVIEFTPVPEPGTAALLLLAISAGLLAQRRH